MTTFTAGLLENVLTIDGALACCALFWVLRQATVLRVSREAELTGLDVALRKTCAYPDDVPCSAPCAESAICRR